MKKIADDVQNPVVGPCGDVAFTREDGETFVVGPDGGSPVSIGKSWAFFSPTGTHVLGERLRHLRTGAETTLPSIDASLGSARATPSWIHTSSDRDLLVVCTNQGVAVIDVTGGGAMTWASKAPCVALHSAPFSDRVVFQEASGDGTRSLHVLDLEKGTDRSLGSQTLDESPVLSALSPDGALFIAQATKRRPGDDTFVAERTELRVFDLAKGSLAHTIEARPSEAQVYFGSGIGYGHAFVALGKPGDDGKASTIFVDEALGMHVSEGRPLHLFIDQKTALIEVSVARQLELRLVDLATGKVHLSGPRFWRSSFGGVRDVIVSDDDGAVLFGTSIGTEAGGPGPLSQLWDLRVWQAERPERVLAQVLQPAAPLGVSGDGRALALGPFSDLPLPELEADDAKVSSSWGTSYFDPTGKRVAQTAGSEQGRAWAVSGGFIHEQRGSFHGIDATGAHKALLETSGRPEVTRTARNVVIVVPGANGRAAIWSGGP